MCIRDSYIILQVNAAQVLPRQPAKAGLADRGSIFPLTSVEESGAGRVAACLKEMQLVSGSGPRNELHFLPCGRLVGGRRPDGLRGDLPTCPPFGRASWQVPTQSCRAGGRTLVGCRGFVLFQTYGFYIILRLDSAQVLPRQPAKASLADRSSIFPLTSVQVVEWAARHVSAAEASSSFTPMGSI